MKNIIIMIGLATLVGCVSNPQTWVATDPSSRDHWYRSKSACEVAHGDLLHDSSAVPRETLGASGAKMWANPNTGETRPEFVQCMATHGWHLT